MAGQTKAHAGAIILALLEPEMASDLLRRMNPDDARRVLYGLRHVQSIEDAEIDQACDAFLAAASVSESNGDASRVRANHNRLIKYLETAGVNPQGHDPFWSDLRGADIGAQIRRVAVGIAPQSLGHWAARNADGPVATLLALLEPESGAGLLAALPADRAVQLLLHLINQHPVDEDSLFILLEDLRELRGRELSLSHRQQFGEPRALELLRALDPTARDRILDDLGDRDLPLAGRLNRGLLRFEQLAQLSRTDLALVLGGLHDRQFAIALKGQLEEIKKVFLSAVSSGRRELIEGELDTLGPVRLSDQQKIHLAVTERARQLRESGRISFPWEDQMVS